MYLDLARITKIEKSETDGYIVAHFSFEIPVTTNAFSTLMNFHKWKLCKSKKGVLFVQSPSYMKENGLGEKMFYPYFTMGEIETQALKSELVRKLSVEFKETQEVPF